MSRCYGISCQIFEKWLLMVEWTGRLMISDKSIKQVVRLAAYMFVRYLILSAVQPPNCQRTDSFGLSFFSTNPPVMTHARLYNTTQAVSLNRNQLLNIIQRAAKIREVCRSIHKWTELQCKFFGMVFGIELIDLLRFIISLNPMVLFYCQSDRD